MSSDGDEDPVRIARVDCELANLLSIAQTEMRPGLAGVGGLIDAVSDGEIGAREAFAAADIDDVGIAERDSDRTDGARRLRIPETVPRIAGVGRLPNTPIDRAHVEGRGLARHTCEGACASGAHGSDLAPTHVGEQCGVDALRTTDGGTADEKQKGSEGLESTCGHISPCASALPMCDAGMRWY